MQVSQNYENVMQLPMWEANQKSSTKQTWNTPAMLKHRSQPAQPSN